MVNLWRKRRWLAFAGTLLAALFFVNVRDEFGTAGAGMCALAFLLGVRRLSRILAYTGAAAHWLDTRDFHWRSGRSARRPLEADLGAIAILPPDEFETYCGDLLEREGFRATVTPQSGDYGVDIWLRRRDGVAGAAQCKQTPNTRHGYQELQRLHSEMTDKGAQFGYFMTTGYFTDNAREWAESKPITLVDRHALLQMVDRHARGQQPIGARSFWATPSS